jgi:hypothetical protein
MSSSNPFNFPRAHVRAQSDKIIQAQTLHESKTVASCVDTTNKLMKVDVAAASGSHGLATEANQTTVINATLRDINNTGSIGDGSTNATAIALGYDRTNGKGRAVLVDDGGRLDVNCLGNTVGDGSGDVKSLHLDGSGNVQTNVVNTVNVAPANSVNSHITDDPANSVAVGLKGRTTIGTATTETFLLCDSDGHLQVDVLSSPSSSSTLMKANDASDGSGTDRTVLCDANGALIVDPSKEGVVSVDGTTTALHAMMLGNNSGNLRTIQCDASGIVSVDSETLSSTVYSDGDAVGAGADGVLMMGKDNSNLAHPVRITANGDVEVEIADFVKGQATKANSFPVVLASDTDTLPVEQSYSYGSEYTIISAQSIANGDSHTSGEFEIQSVKNIQAIISLSVSAGGSTNYDVDFEGSLNGSDFYEFPDATIFASADAILSTEKSGIVPVRYMKVKITNNHGSGSHTFTVKGSVLGATLAAP